jgi:hypothetical protein
MLLNEQFDIKTNAQKLVELIFKSV